MGTALPSCTPLGRYLAPPPHRACQPPGNAAQHTLHPYLMVWLMMMGSGCCRSPASFMGISEKRMRTQLKIWRGKAECLLSVAGAPPTRHTKGQAGGGKPAQPWFVHGKLVDVSPWGKGIN